MIPEVLAEYEDDYRFFLDAAMRKIGTWNDDLYPEEVVSRILDGEHPIKVFRQFRRMSQEQLARKVGVPASFINDLESGGGNASRAALADIARELRVEIRDIS